MRSHQEIVKQAGAAKLARQLVERGRSVHQSTPQRWADRNSVPGEYWVDLVELGAASLDELAKSASQKIQPPPANDASAQDAAA